jgi:hypothetical protein
MATGRIIAVLAVLAVALSADASRAEPTQQKNSERERLGVGRRPPGMHHPQRDRLHRERDHRGPEGRAHRRWEEATPEMRERFRDATPLERREIRERHLDRMRQFSDDNPRRRDDAWQQLSREDRMAIRDEVDALPPAERHDLRTKIRHFHALPPEEQAELQRRFGQLRSLEPGEQTEVHDNARRFQEMDPEVQDRLRDTMRRFRDLPPEKQQEWLDRALEVAPDQTP